MKQTKDLGQQVHETVMLTPMASPAIIQGYGIHPVPLPKVTNGYQRLPMVTIAWELATVHVSTVKTQVTLLRDLKAFKLATDPKSISHNHQNNTTCCKCGNFVVKSFKGWIFKRADFLSEHTHKNITLWKNYTQHNKKWWWETRIQCRFRSPSAVCVVGIK